MGKGEEQNVEKKEAINKLIESEEELFFKIEKVKDLRY